MVLVAIWSASLLTLAAATLAAGFGTEKSPTFATPSCFTLATQLTSVGSNCPVWFRLNCSNPQTCSPATLYYEGVLLDLDDSPGVPRLRHFGSALAGRSHDLETLSIEFCVASGERCEPAYAIGYLIAR